MPVEITTCIVLPLAHDPDGAELTYRTPPLFEPREACPAAAAVNRVTAAAATSALRREESGFGTEV
jgi:hypothetical protein